MMGNAIHKPIEPRMRCGLCGLMFFILLLFSATVRAQDPLYRSYNTSSGLCSNQVFEMLQDRKGYLWFSTNQGVSRFDGRNFKNFTGEEGMIDNSIIGLDEDYKGRIWCRGITGRICFIEGDSIINIEAKIPGYFANSLFVDDDDVIWVGCQSLGQYYKIHPPYQQQNLEIINTSHKGIYIVRHPRGIIYTRNDLSQTAILEDLRYGTLTRLNIPNSKTNLKVKSSGDSLFVGSDERVYSISNNTARLVLALDFTPINLFADPISNLWICHPSSGINRFSGAAGESYFTDFSINGFMQDHEGSYWFATSTQGVIYVRSLDSKRYTANLKHTQRIDKLYATPDGIIATTIYGEAMKIDSVNRISYIDIKSTVPEGFKLSKHANFFNNYVDGVVIKQLANQGFSHLIENNRTLQQSETYEACYSLVCYQALLRNQKIQDAYTAPVRINASATMGSDSIMLATNSGLYVFSRGKFHSFNDPSGKLFVRINELEYDSNGRLWMATAGKGILMLDGKKISHFSNDQGLNSNYCESITIQNDSIFIGTRHGINLLRFDSSSAVSITNLSKTMGFPDQTAYALKAYLNRIYVLSDDGLTSHSLVEQNNPLQPPRVYIESLQANGISVPLSGKIEIPYNQNNVVIRFSCISFLSPNTNYFKYKLSGSDEDWKTTSASELNFASLQPGKYELRVIGFNALDIASGEPLTIAFTILPAWWNSTQFIVLSGFAIFLVVFFSIRYWIHLEKKKVREKEATLTQLAAVEMRALRAQMNPHFIFNSLNSIQHYILEQDKITAHSLLSRFSKLMRNVLDNSKEDHISLLKELETLKLYLDLEMIRFQDRFNYEIVIDPELETLTTMIPPMIIQPFVENAILHGVLPKTTDDGFISIHLERREQSIFCSVRDNGIGRKKANELHQFSEDEHQSHGLSITRERLQLHNKAQKHQHPIEFEFHDLFDARGIAMGTRVEIIIPALSTTQ